jgi:hypothetical protein
LAAFDAVARVRLIELRGRGIAYAEALTTGLQAFAQFAVAGQADIQLQARFSGASAPQAK